MLTILEHPSSGYTPRTIRNASMADLTVAFAVDFTTAGEKLTKNSARGKYVAIAPDAKYPAQIIIDYLRDHRHGKPVELNIAGNGIYTLAKHGVTQEHINKAVYAILGQVRQAYPIRAIRSGGQTGADLAGAVAGVVMNLPTQVLLPQGFKQRNIHGEDVLLSEAAIRQQIVNYAAALR